MLRQNFPVESASQNPAMIHTISLLVVTLALACSGQEQDDPGQSQVTPSDAESETMFIPFNKNPFMQIQKGQDEGVAGAAMTVNAGDQQPQQQPAMGMGVGTGRKRRLRKRRRTTTSTEMPEQQMRGENGALKAMVLEKEEIERKATPKYKKASNGRLTMGQINENE